MASSSSSSSSRLSRANSLGGSQRRNRAVCALGVLMTGYLDKVDPNALLPKKRHRFLVLTHEGLHWFKREKGLDLFGEERGSISLADVGTAEVYPADETAFAVTTSDSQKRIFYGASKEEAKKWVHAIHLAIKSRYLYRRETLTGLSFVQSMDESDGSGITRPRILMYTFIPHAIAPPPAAGATTASPVSVTTASTRTWPSCEFVLGRNCDYEKSLSLPPLHEEDQVTFNFVNGASATLLGADILQYIRNSDTVASPEGDENKIKAVLRGGSGGGGTLVMNALVVPQQAPSSDATDGTAATKKWQLVFKTLVLDLLQVEHSIPLTCAVFLGLVIRATNTGMAPITFASLYDLMLQDRKAGAMLFVAVGLFLSVLLALIRDISYFLERVSGTSGSNNNKQQQESLYTKDIYLEIEDYLPPAPVRDTSKEGGAAAGADIAGDGGEGKPIPQRFIDGCLGDVEEAMRRWALTCEWRREFGTDDILWQPHPFFKLIKECYPHYYCLTSKSGDPVYIERSGQVDQPRMRAAGCGIDVLVWHYIYMTEFIWTKLYPGEEGEKKKTCTVFDVQGVGIRDLAGEAFDFLRKSSTLVQEHYPERSLVIQIINCPGWFSVLWKMIKPMINPRTLQKIKIVGKSESLACLREFIADEHIPVCYGGKLRYTDDPDSCRWHSPEEVALRKHVEEVNKRHGVEFIME